VLCSLALDKLFKKLMEETLFGGSANAGGGWLWRSDKIDSKTEVVIGYCLGGFVERANDRMANTFGEVELTAWCGSLF
jgi:hypothetical protein